MENIKEEYKKAVKYFLDNKLFIVSVILITVLSFGFTITNSSIGMDDTAFDVYYKNKEMLSIGRWGSYIIYQVLNISEFVPFWIDFIASSEIMLTAVLWCIFLKKNLGEKLSTGAYIAFATAFISFPIINEIFIFENCNIAVMLGSFLASLGIMMFYENYINVHKKRIYFVSILTLTFALSMYEACVQIMLVAICITAIMIIFLNKDKKIKDIFKYLFGALAVVTGAIILNTIIVKLIYLIGVEYSAAADKRVSWGQYNLIDSLVMIIYYIVDALKNIHNFSVVVFLTISVIGLFISVSQSDKNKNWMILLIFFAMFLSNFAISMIQLGYVYYRTCTSWSLYVAIIIMIFYKLLSNHKITKILAGVAICILVLQQSRMLNQLFYNDYMRYQKDLHIAYDLIYSLQENYDTTKPLVITGDIYRGMNKYASQSNSISVLWWGKKSFGVKGSEFIKFLNSLGYKFRIPTNEEVEKGKQEAENMSRYPQEGSIKELEDCIVINF